MSLEQKQTVVSEVAAKLGNAQAVIVAEYRGLDVGRDLFRIASGGVDQTRGEAFIILDQHLEQMFGQKLLMPGALSQHLGGLHETARTLGIFFEIHRSCPFQRPVSRGPATAATSRPSII